MTVLSQEKKQRRQDLQERIKVVQGQLALPPGVLSAYEKRRLHEQMGRLTQELKGA